MRQEWKRTKIKRETEKKKPWQERTQKENGNRREEERNNDKNSKSVMTVEKRAREDSILGREEERGSKLHNSCRKKKAN